MPLQIPIQPVPSQQILCVLAGQNCQLAIYQKGDSVYFDLNSNGTNMCIGCIAENGVPLDSCNSYDGFQGNLFFIDTQGIEDPDFNGFGTRWVLVYMNPAELAESAFVPVIIPSSIPTLTLSATLDITAPNDGNFSIAHGLQSVPFLIEIIPTSGGAIWGQAGFADATNINLVASEAGVTASVLLFTVTTSDLIVQTPALMVEVVSTGPGPFDWPHGLGALPSLIEILPTFNGTLGAIWAQDPEFDATNLKLVASDAGVTVTVSVYAPLTGDFNIKGPATILGVVSPAPGPFDWPHGLSSMPSRIGILMISDGVIAALSPEFDASNVHLEASDAGLIAKIFVYA